MPRDQDRSKKSSYSDLHNARGIELAERGWFDEAVKEFEKAIAIDEACAHAYDNLANIYAEKGNLLKALKYYVKAIEIDEENPTSHYNLGCFLANHAPELAVGSYTTAATLDSDFPDVYLSLGLSLADQGEYEKAIESFKKSLTMDPADYEARFGLANAFMELSQHTKAITEFKRVIVDDVDNVQAYLNLGICYTIKGFYSEAEKYFVQATGLDENDVSVNYHFAALRALQGRSEECIELMRRALKLDSGVVKRWLESDGHFVNVRTLAKFRELLIK